MIEKVENGVIFGKWGQQKVFVGCIKYDFKKAS
jgi:hypothetical protein